MKDVVVNCILPAYIQPVSSLFHHIFSVFKPYFHTNSCRVIFYSRQVLTGTYFYHIFTIFLPYFARFFYHISTSRFSLISSTFLAYFQDVNPLPEIKAFQYSGVLSTYSSMAPGSLPPRIIENHSENTQSEKTQ